MRGKHQFPFCLMGPFGGNTENDLAPTPGTTQSFNHLREATKMVGLWPENQDVYTAAKSRRILLAEKKRARRNL